MPAWVTSDRLTILGLGALLLSGVTYWYAKYHPWALLLVVVWLFVNWFGDSLDGTLARVRRLERPRYGFYVDHVCDTFGTLFMLGGLALSGYMSPLVAVGLVIAYYMLSIESYLATYTIGTFRLSYFKFSPTELRIVLAIGSIALLYHPRVNLWGGKYLLFDVGGVIAMVGMGLMLLTAVIRNTGALYRAEPLP
jgi:phosphatidylglycerophosphate synthase